jgi:hypothetical protein
MRLLKGLRWSQELLLVNMIGGHIVQQDVLLSRLQEEQPKEQEDVQTMPWCQACLQEMQAAHQDMQKEMLRILDHTDALLKCGARLSITAEMGPEYARTVHAKSLADLLARIVLHPPQPGGHSAEQVATAAAQRLLAEQVPQSLARVVAYYVRCQVGRLLAILARLPTRLPTS